MTENKEGNGICVFAYNNTNLDYVKFASIVSKYSKRNMKNNKVALITDVGTESWMQQSLDKNELQNCFDYVIVTDPKHKNNPRVHYDSPWTEFTAQFLNSNKDQIIKYTPFERTLLIDVDFLIQKNF